MESLISLVLFHNFGIGWWEYLWWFFSECGITLKAFKFASSAVEDYSWQICCCWDTPGNYPSSCLCNRLKRIPCDFVLVLLRLIQKANLGRANFDFPWNLDLLILLNMPFLTHKFEMSPYKNKIRWYAKILKYLILI